MKTKTILAGCGASILLMRSYLAMQFSPYHLGLYRNPLPEFTVVRGLIIDLTVLSLLATLFFVYLERRDADERSIFWSFVAAELVATLTGFLEIGARISIPHLTHGTILIATLVVALGLRWLVPQAYRVMTRGVKLTLALIGCSVFWMAPVLLHRAMSQPSNPQEAAGIEHTSARLLRANDSPGGRRIIWLLFDELSYNQVFVHRFPGLALPEFDDFKRQSINFQNLKPAGYYTYMVIPSLFSGDVVEDLRSDLKGDALVRVQGETDWRRFDAKKTLFGEAQRHGWTTGVVGWFNPYCRILAGTLDTCYWESWPDLTLELMPDKSSLYNALVPIRSKLRELEQKPDGFTVLREKDHPAIMQEGEKLIRNDKVSFLFIHLLVPHPPGFYDRRTGQLRDHGTYIDNLALADRSLRELMAAIRSTPSSDKTTVIVCSDHSWRVPMWRPGAWSKEEEAATHGKFDQRPVLMIHFPEQTSEIDITRPFPAIELHSMIESMLQGGLQSSAEFQSWVQQNPGEGHPPLAQAAKNGF